MKRARGKAKQAPPRKSSPAHEAPTAAKESVRCPLVAIGASAGGLEVFQQFFSHMPPDSGMAFVLIQHLDPNHETLIPELLTNYTAMPVQRVLEPVQIEPNHIYVIPANAL